jgi:hypothetical protein
MQKIVLNVVVWSVFSLFLLNSCKKHDHDHHHETELITLIKMTLIAPSVNDTVVFKYEDADGDGGNQPVITNGTLKSNTTYIANMEIKNTSVTPNIDVTKQILNEATAHQFFFIEKSNNQFDITYDDLDANGKPLGLKTKWMVKAPGTQSLKVVLRHEPNKNGANVSSGVINNAGGETDIEVVWNVTVQ